MKISIFAFLILCGCAQNAIYSNEEVCASRNLIFEKMSVGTISGGSVIENISCKVPSTKFDECEIYKYKKSAAPKEVYNRSQKANDALTTAGYIAWVVPGILLREHFESNRKQSEKQSLEIRESITCTNSEQKTP